MCYAIIIKKHANVHATIFINTLTCTAFASSSHAFDLSTNENFYFNLRIISINSSMHLSNAIFAGFLNLVIYSISLSYLYSLELLCVYLFLSKEVKQIISNLPLESATRIRVWDRIFCVHCNYLHAISFELRLLKLGETLNLQFS